MQHSLKKWSTSCKNGGPAAEKQPKPEICIRALVFHFDPPDPADICHDPQSFTMICNSSTILYHDPADPADPADITYIRNDPQWSASHILPYIMIQRIRRISPIPAMIRYDSQVMYLPFCETYVLMGGPGGLAPLENQSNSSLLYRRKWRHCIASSRWYPSAHRDDITLL